MKQGLLSPAPFLPCASGRFRIAPPMLLRKGNVVVAPPANKSWRRGSKDMQVKATVATSGQGPPPQCLRNTTPCSSRYLPFPRPGETEWERSRDLRRRRSFGDFAKRWRDWISSQERDSEGIPPLSGALLRGSRIIATDPWRDPVEGLPQNARHGQSAVRSGTERDRAWAPETRAPVPSLAPSGSERIRRRTDVHPWQNQMRHRPG